MSVILFFIGLLSGVISGMGIGGGAILVPALTIFMGIDQKVAQAMNLVYFIPTALIAIFTHSKKGNIQKKGILPIILFGIVGAFIGSILANNMESKLLRKIFGWFLMLMGLKEIFKKGEEK